GAPPGRAAPSSARGTSPWIGRSRDRPRGELPRRLHPLEDLRLERREHWSAAEEAHRRRERDALGEVLVPVLDESGAVVVPDLHDALDRDDALADIRRRAAANEYALNARLVGRLNGRGLVGDLRHRRLLSSRR